MGTCDSLLEPGGRILLLTLVYDQEQMKGQGLGRFSLPDFVDIQARKNEKLWGVFF